VLGFSERREEKRREVLSGGRGATPKALTAFGVARDHQ
jgi:hypothetical protein